VCNDNSVRRRQVSGYLEAANGSMMRVALQHDLDVLYGLLPRGPGTSHFVRYLLCSFLQLRIQTNY